MAMLPALLTSRARLVPHRSTRDPANGAARIDGSRPSAKMTPSVVAEPVRRYTYTPNAKPLRPDPSSERNWPAQTVR